MSKPLKSLQATLTERKRSLSESSALGFQHEFVVCPVTILHQMMGGFSLIEAFIHGPFVYPCERLTMLGNVNLLA